MSRYIEKLDAFCTRLERRTGLLTTSFILALIIIVFDMLYITPHFEVAYHGLRYADLSRNPFDFSDPNPLRYRILPSLIGFVLFLRGGLFVMVPLLFAVLFVAMLYFIYRKKNYRPVDSILFTGLIAFSCTIYIQLAAPGYTDAVFYFFVFLAFAFAEKIVYSALFFGLALLTHESSLFLLPGLLLYSWYLNRDLPSKVLKHLLLLVIAMIPMLLYRRWVSAHVPVEYDLNFYFSAKNIEFCARKVLPLLPGGAFYAFKLFWFFPLYVLYKSWKQKEYIFFSVIAAILICDLAQLIIAFDITRMLCLGFPAILLSAQKVKEQWEPGRFTRTVSILTVFNFLVIQYYMSCDGINPMLPSPYTIITQFFVQ